MPHQEDALSEIVAQMLIAFLIIIVTLLLIASLTGVLTGFLQNPGLLVVTAGPYDTTGGHVIRLHHEQGNPVNLNGTLQNGGKTEIAIVLISASGTPVFVKSAGSMGTEPWGPGKDLYIYPAAGGYQFMATPPAGSPVTPGEYTLRIIDMRTEVLLHSIPVTIP
jgi:hypothetical protein